MLQRQARLRAPDTFYYPGSRLASGFRNRRRIYAALTAGCRSTLARKNSACSEHFRLARMQEDRQGAPQHTYDHVHMTVPRWH